MSPAFNFLKRSGFFISIIAFSACSPGKSLVKTDTETLRNIQKHVGFLADDKLEGRRTGTPGEELAAEYIAARFREYDISPKGTEYYTQSFIVNDGKKIDSSTSLIINGTKLEAGTGFFPFPYSPDITMEALPSIAVQEAGMPWFFDLEDVLEENKANPHFDLPAYIRTNAKKAMDRGASAVILYNSSALEDKLAFDSRDRAEKSGIPVIYVSKSAAARLFADPGATLNMKMTISISEKTRVGHNVIGYINNNAPTTVVLGAHYDHLGYGEDGNSMNRNGSPAIHNGADDNASGTSALIELARLLKKSKARNNNYLFIAFSGEELGLYGSKYFTENPTIDLSQANYMINMDMVGRLNDSTKVITIGGYGTSPVWPEFWFINPPAHSQPKKDFVISPLNIKIDSSGTGPSDHTSFYRKNIPVLFYFTGLHSDYHKPGDDADKVNYKGEVTIIEHVISVIDKLDDNGKLPFTKTREAQTTTSARFSVSLGIMPDYTYAGSGVRADGVSDGKPAQKAGIKAGDVIISIGEHNINSLEQYMQALGRFKKGDRTVVKFKRGNDTHEVTVEF